MTGSTLRHVRQGRGMTQGDAAARLGVSQPYLSLLETGRRRVPASLVHRIQRHFDVSAHELPLGRSATRLDVDQLAAQCAALGYPGFAPRPSVRRLNPAQVLLAALRHHDLDTRLAEALPWLVLRYSELDWGWTLQHARQEDLQNRLGFVIALARGLAKRGGRRPTLTRLADIEMRLERSRLAREDTLCHDSMTEAERRWVREHRIPDARHWNLLTDLSSDRLPYAW
jgi:transcriptional regulator with XRE-family HTH domain